MLITLCRKLALPAVQLLLGLLLTLGMAWAQPIPLSVAAVKNKMLAAVKAGDAANAIELGEQWLANAQKVPVPNPEEQAEILFVLGDAYFASERYLQAENAFRHALSMSEKIGRLQNSKTANNFIERASTHLSNSENKEAFVLALAALFLTEKITPLNHEARVDALNVVGRVYLSLGWPELAILNFYNAEFVSAIHLGPTHPSSILSWSNLAVNYVALGQYENALLYQLRVLEMWEVLEGPEHPGTALSLNNLAITYSALAQNDKALELQERALKIREKAFGLSHIDTAESLNNLASIYSDLDQFNKALPLNLRALKIHEELLGSEHSTTALSLNNLAETYCHLNEHDMGLPLHFRALHIFESLLGKEHPDTAMSLSNIALCYESKGLHTLAIGFLKKAINQYQNQRERISAINKAELEGYTRLIQGNYQALAWLLVDQSRLAEAQQVLDMLKEDEVFEFVRRSSTADPRRTRVAYTPTEARWLVRNREIADRLGALGAEEQALQKQAKQGLTPAQEARLKALQTDLAVAKKAFLAFLGDLQKDLSARGPARAAEVAEASERAQRELQTLVRGMGPDVALLQYYITTDRVGMILTTPGSVQAFNTPVDAKELNRQIAAYRAVLRTPAADTLPGAQALYRLLVAPVAPTLERAGVKTIMLSLDGNLRHLPFGALHDGKQYLAQRWQLPLYTAVVKDKLRDAVSPHWNTAGLGVTKALGDFKALPAVKGELAGVLRANTGNAGTKGELFLDEDFTATRLKDVGQRNFQLMHVSSHFQLSPGTEINSFLLLGDGTRLTLGDMRNQNYRFDQVDLLTLAACDTGLGGGRDANGKEIEVLGVLAQQQGARAVLATLWPVADQSTATLMADMYQRRQAQGLSKAEALRQAQLALMAQPKYAHPFYWAPFILMGNWK